MRLAFCIFKYFPYGGLERNFLHVIEECLRRGHQVNVFTHSWEGEIPSKLAITYVAEKGFSNHRRCKYFANNIQKKISREQYDAIVGFNKMPGLDIYLNADICYKAKVYNHQSFLHRLLPRYRIYSHLEQAVFAHNSNTQILSYKTNELKNYVYHYKTPPARFCFLPPDFTKPLEPLDKNHLREKLKKELALKAEHLLLMVGSHFKTKGVDRSLHALASLPPKLKQETQLLIVGQGKSKPFIQLARKLSIADQVTFLGTRNDVVELMGATDVLLHPSYHEFAGKVILEALSVGLPVLVTENCGFAYHVTHANAGIVIPSPFQQDKLNFALQSALQFQLTEHSKYYQWQENAIHYTKHLRTGDIAKKVTDFIESYVNKLELQREFN